VKVGLCRDAALFVDDFVDALVGKLRVFGEPVGRNAHRRKELFTEEFAGWTLMCLFMVQ